MISILIISYMVHNTFCAVSININISIPKDKRQLLCTSDNFRAITLGSIVAKLFDVFILSKEQTFVLGHFAVAEDPVIQDGQAPRILDANHPGQLRLRDHYREIFSMV